MTVDNPRKTRPQIETARLKKQVAQLKAELEKTRQKLSERNREFQKAFKDPAIGMMRFSPDGDLLAANAYVCNMLGYTQEELKTKNYKEITHPDDLGASVLSEYKILNRELLYDHLEKRYIKKDGGIAWILLSYSMLFDRNAKPMYYISHLQDITKRKQIETSLQASEKRFALFMQNFPGAAFIKDYTGHYIYVNQFFEKRYEKKHPDGVLGLTDKDLFPESYCQQYDQNSVLALSEGKAMTFIETTPGENQEDYWLTSRFPIFLDGKSPLLGCVCLDTTKLIRTKEQLKAKEIELKNHAENLNEMNTALKVLLDHREKEKLQMEQNIFANLKKLVAPYLDKLQDTKLNDTQMTFLDIALSHLDDITSPMAANLLSLESRLTPTELDIAVLIRHGKSTDIISDLMNISSTTVAFHRRNIRDKLGLKHKKKNLMTHLRTIS